MSGRNISGNKALTFDIDGIRHERLDNGFVRQVDPSPFTYVSDYAESQSTTVEMSYLRLGVIECAMGYDALAAARVLELGPGTGVMMEVMRRHCLSVDGFDVAPTDHVTVSHDEATKRRWDLLIACDVIEHFPDVDALFGYDFDWAYISTPCRPDDIELMANWRHFKPNEHIWYFSRDELAQWFESRGYEVRYAGHTEDLIRSRWDRTKANISNFVIRRKI